MRKILLNKCKSKTSVNETNVIPVEISRDASMFHDEHFLETIDTMEVYNKEKDASHKHRIICTVSPLCSNVLFNNITEVVYKEGAPDCKAITNNSANGVSLQSISTATLNRIQAIRNTEYSNEKFPMTYHCGSDIFNNHTLRTKTNIIVQPRKNKRNFTEYGGIETNSGVENNGSGSASAVAVIGDWDYQTTSSLHTSQIDAFNTIGDYCRDYKGNEIISYFPGNSDYTYENKYSGFTPLYTYDTIKSFNEAFNDGISRHDGWMGFKNRTTFRIPVSGTTTNGYFVNKCINNIEGCEYVDMCPERDLFSFTPKKNQYRNRLEYNWNYFLTYPAISDYNDGQILKGKGKGLPLGTFQVMGSAKLLHYKEYVNTNGVSILQFKSIVKHNLKVGDSVSIILSNTNERFKCQIIKLGDNDGKQKNRVFSIYKEDIDFSLITEDNFPERFVKLSGGFECEYYFRKFKKINNIRSTINKLAFANTIYGDDVSQIVFTDDVDVSGLKNNLGMPLTELYLTVLKNNKGYKTWYENKQYGNDSVEFSHVFGKVTSGLDLLPDSGTDYPNIRRQHNIDVKDLTEIKIPTSASKLEDIQTTMLEFYGDLVEFNPMTVKETVLEVVKHRFNTAQRETRNSDYNTIFYDEIYADQYDGENYSNKSNLSGNTQIIQWGLNVGYANLNPEGYVYAPHHKIKIGELSDTIQQRSDSLIKCTNGEFKTTNTGYTFTFNTQYNYELLANDIIGILDYETNILYKYLVEKYERVEEGNYLCSCRPQTNEKIDYVGELTNRYEIFKHNTEIPEYAYMLPDGSGRHIWRDVVKPSEMSFTSDLYDVVFTNGAFYHHENISFPVRRQDPFGEYGMYVRNSEDIKLKNNFSIASNKMDISYDDYVQEMEGGICF